MKRVVLAASAAFLLIGSPRAAETPKPKDAAELLAWCGEAATHKRCLYLLNVGYLAGALTGEYCAPQGETAEAQLRVFEAAMQRRPALLKGDYEDAMASAFKAGYRCKSGQGLDARKLKSTDELP